MNRSTAYGIAPRDEESTNLIVVGWDALDKIYFMHIVNESKNTTDPEYWVVDATAPDLQLLNSLVKQYSKSPDGIPFSHLTKLREDAER